MDMAESTKAQEGQGRIGLGPCLAPVHSLRGLSRSKQYVGDVMRTNQGADSANARPDACTLYATEGTAGLVERRIPFFTSLDTARAAVESLLHGPAGYSIRRRDEYLEEG